MKKWYSAKCSQCGRGFRSQTRSELLSKIRKHIWKEHRAWMVARIKAGQRTSNANNPSLQDLIQGVQKGSSRAAISVARQMTEGRYQQVKKVLDVVQPILPLKAQLAWEGVEAAHDLYRRFKPKRS
ncbi:hypothetical protein ES703_116795 [subsurface metagenome]